MAPITHVRTSGFRARWIRVVNSPQSFDTCRTNHSANCKPHDQWELQKGNMRYFQVTTNLLILLLRWERTDWYEDVELESCPWYGFSGEGDRNKHCDIYTKTVGDKELLRKTGVERLSKVEIRTKRKANPQYFRPAYKKDRQANCLRKRN